MLCEGMHVGVIMDLVYMTSNKTDSLQWLH